MTESYLPAQAAPAAAPRPPAATRPARDRSYAEWFTWARQHVNDVAASHAAARAALLEQDGGRDVNSAAMAAQRAAADPQQAPGTVDPRLESYAGWYAWANLDLKLDKNLSHVAAAAAAEAQEQGEPPAAAAEAAMAAAGLPGHATRPAGGRLPLWQDRGVRAIAFGILCLVAPFVFHIYFPIMPIFGLLYAWRALSSKRLPLAIVALVINGIAMLLNILIFLHIL